MSREGVAGSLGPDEAAIVDLIVGRGLDYAGIADVTGIAIPDVRARARRALTTLGASDPGDLVTAYLLGVGSRDERLRGRQVLDGSADEAAVARSIVAALKAGWSGYEAPAVPAAPGGVQRWLLWVAGAGLAAGLLIAILFLTGIVGGGGDPPSRIATPDPPPAPVKIALKGTGTATGTATIGVNAAFKPYLQLDLLAVPSPKNGAVYLLWIDNGDGRGYPLPTPIDTNGGDYHQRYQLSTALAPLLSLGKSIQLRAVSSKQLAQLAQEVSAAGASGKPAALPRRPGTVLLSGPIPDR